MSIQEFGSKRLSSEPNLSYKPLWLCLIIALLVRVWLTIHTQGFIDGDEALVGIQAQHILHGEWPVYFYNQPYMGSLEAYLMALIFAVVGSSVWALRAEPILLSLVVVWLTWALAGELADTARLPLQVKQWFMSIAALLAAIPPLYDTVLELRTLGGYVETFVLMLLLLLLTLKLTNRRREEASGRILSLYWTGIGLVVGLGFWVNPLIIYAVLAAAAWLLLDFVLAWRQFGKFSVWLKRAVLPALPALPAAIVGATPALIWGANNHWQNITFMFQMGSNASLRPEIVAHYPTRLSIAVGLVKLYTTCVGPRLVGGALPGEDPTLRLLHSPTLLLGGFCILATLTLVALSYMYRSDLLLRARKLVALPLLFAGSTSLIFCATSTAAIGLWNCQYDLAGRYATPIMLVLPFFYAAVFAAFMLLETQLFEKGGSKREQQDSSTSLIPQAVNLRFERIGSALLVGCLLVSVLFQVGYYGSTDAGNTFQSPYCTDAPANNDAIISYMQREHIRYAWGNNWIGYSIVFKTRGQIIVADPMPLIRNIPSLNRLPANTDAVLKADRPSLLVIVKHSDPHPVIMQQLEQANITYRLARFPSENGFDVLVITPLNSTVRPLSAAYFNVFICSRDA
ncbi:MAG TPA: hypothetical protein VFA41_05560 [Ktedonobacteraceae bacterium]|jgi:hypothetical protein|nr:hypothetical protein [Ktedonobacteraceae bacterium]